MSRTVMITGCDRGIGLGLARQFLKEGYKVISTCLNVKSHDCQDLCGNKDCTCVEMNVCDDSSIQKAYDQIKDRCDIIDILINNAGIASKNHPDDPALNIQRDEMLNIYNTDVIGALSVTKIFKSLMEKGNEKKIVNISSNMGSVSLNEPNNEHGLWVGNTTSYRCAKAALNMASRNLAYELPEFVVVTIHPGWVDTEMGSAKGEVKFYEKVVQTSFNAHINWIMKTPTFQQTPDPRPEPPTPPKDAPPPPPELPPNTTKGDPSTNPPPKKASLFQKFRDFCGWNTNEHTRKQYSTSSTEKNDSSSIAVDPPEEQTPLDVYPNPIIAKTTPFEGDGERPMDIVDPGFPPITDIPAESEPKEGKKSPEPLPKSPESEKGPMKPEFPTGSPPSNPPQMNP